MKTRIFSLESTRLYAPCTLLFLLLLTFLLWPLFTQVISLVEASEPALEIDEEFLSVTCGSAIKLTHEASAYKLHSHSVSYGTGSGQQSVTGLPDADDHNSLWQVHSALGNQCLRGQTIPCNSVIRLKHVVTSRFLHSHQHQSPLSQQQEVSAYEGQDNGDNWKLICSNKSVPNWQREEKIQLIHIETNTYLTANKEHAYSNPIPGQIEVSAAKSGGKLTFWIAQEGIYFPIRQNLNISNEAAEVGATVTTTAELKPQEQQPKVFVKDWKQVMLEASNRTDLQLEEPKAPVKDWKQVMLEASNRTDLQLEEPKAPVKDWKQVMLEASIRTDLQPPETPEVFTMIMEEPKAPVKDWKQPMPEATSKTDMKLPETPKVSPIKTEKPMAQSNFRQQPKFNNNETIEKPRLQLSQLAKKWERPTVRMQDKIFEQEKTNNETIEKPRPQPSQLARVWERPTNRLQDETLGAGIALNESKTTFVLISRLPLTAIPSDIRNLAKKELEPSIKEICVWRNEFYRCTGKIAVAFDSQNAAERFIGTNLNNTVAGQRISCDFIDEDIYTRNRIRELVKRPGTHVTLSGLPGTISNKRMDHALTGYAIIDREYTGIKLLRSMGREITSKWLIKLESTREAHRLIRDVNNQYFMPGELRNEFLVQAAIVY
ncbi:12577_t:CDS:10 [Ambispora gerdemannii]|uniref:12577_t:CDS:1 n=1 Tax=Ambispora gerdemannii TaxID=144530 RepID=A0A9N8ZAB7_9GLOM|nr:12577_t:CDS:10 [Ambispora gerdemannii]